MEGDDARLARVEERVNSMSDDMSSVKESLKEIAGALKSLAVLEEKHNSTTEAIKRAFNIIDKHETRLDSIEKALPNLVLASSWIFKAMLWVMGVLGMVALGHLLKGIVK